MRNDRLRAVRERSFWKKSLFLGLSTVGVLVAYTLWFPWGSGQSKQFVIVPGETAEGIGGRLAQEEIIPSAFLFRLFLLVTDRAQSLQPGIYTIPGHLSLARLATLLSREQGGKLVRVTIPEGYTLLEIGKVLERFEVVSFHDFFELKPASFPEFVFLSKKSTLEGFLFPDTYFFRTHTPAEEVVRVFLKTFQRKALPLLTSNEWYASLILASIVEAEVPHQDDRPVIAGILIKRLQSGMRIQVDSTVNYVTGGTRSALTIKELELDSPYNTYRNHGLPPTPIGNPGAESIKAVMSPQVSEYWFFLSDEQGRTHYAKDFETHKLNKAKYLR